MYAKTKGLCGTQCSTVESKESTGIPDRFFHPVRHEIHLDNNTSKI